MISKVFSNLNNAVIHSAVLGHRRKNQTGTVPGDSEADDHICSGSYPVL